VTDQGVVYDLGYKPHEGPRLGRGAAIKATIRDGLRRVFGLRRRARKKILPWMLFIIALLPAIVFVGLVFLTSQIAAGELIDTPFANHATYFDLAAGTVLLFCGLAAPELVIPDRIDGVLSVYSSRPMTTLDYLSARAAGLALAVAGFLLTPQLLLYFGFAALGPDGFAGEIVGNLDDLVRILGATAAYLVAYAAPAFLVAVFAKRLAPATGIYLGIMFVSTGVASAFTDNGANWAGLLALADHPSYVRDWLFDSFSNTVPENAGFEPWASLSVIVGIAVVTMYVAVRRYRSLM
jgi:ABC-2 type transport system permease protein